METSLKVELTIDEISERAGLSTEVVVELVEEGVMEPRGDAPEDWIFDSTMLCIALRAARLHRDFNIEWTGIPLYLDMIEQLEQLREENQKLRRRLGRFLLDE